MLVELSKLSDERRAKLNNNEDITLTAGDINIFNSATCCCISAASHDKRMRSHAGTMLTGQASLDELLMRKTISLVLKQQFPLCCHTCPTELCYSFSGFFMYVEVGSQIGICKIDEIVANLYDEQDNFINITFIKSQLPDQNWHHMPEFLVFRTSREMVSAS